jgi:hypothetical protein
MAWTDSTRPQVLQCWLRAAPRACPRAGGPHHRGLRAFAARRGGWRRAAGQRWPAGGSTRCSLQRRRHGRRSQGRGRGLRHGGFGGRRTAALYHQHGGQGHHASAQAANGHPHPLGRSDAGSGSAGHCHRGCGYGENGVFLHGFPCCEAPDGWRHPDGPKVHRLCGLVQRLFRKACKHLFGRRQCMRRLYSALRWGRCTTRGRKLGPWFRWGKTGDLCRFAVHWSACPARANPSWAGTWPSG